MAFLKNIFKKKKEGADKGQPGGAPEPELKATKEDFESLDLLGKGSFAKVVLARHIATKKYYAMKIVTKQGLLDHKRVKDVFTEKSILFRASHPFLLKLHYTFQSEHKLFFVMDYMPGGDLDKYMNAQPNKMLDFNTARLYGAQVLLAIMYLHEHAVIYRDLKPENILLSAQGNCVLADFGLSKDFHTEGVDDADQAMRATSFVGSPFYVSPDVLKQKEYTSAVDFWSFGILLYRMLCGRPPFSGRNMKEVFDNIMFTDLRFPSSIPVSPEAKDLISKLLVKDAAKRAKGPEVRAHPFWSGLNFDDVLALKILPASWRPVPTVEEMLARKGAQQQAAAQAPPPAAQPGAKPAEHKEQPKDVVMTPANAQGLPTQQQELFVGFSHTADSAL